MKKITCFLLILLMITVTVACSDSELKNARIKSGAIKSSSGSGFYNKPSELTSSLQDFCANYTLPIIKTEGLEENTAISPVSLYVTLAMAAECAGGETRDEILNFLNIDYMTLASNVNSLIKRMNVYYNYTKLTGKDGINSRLILDSSIWLDKKVDFKDDCLNVLSNNYNASSFSVDFYNNNAKANKLIKAHVKEATYGLINKDFQIDYKTIFTLISALYLKEVWNERGDDCALTSNPIEFTSLNGSKTSKKFLYRDYLTARKLIGENFTAFFTNTCHGYKIYFILPDEGVSVGNAMTAENIKQTLDYSYNGVDKENKILYKTNCKFPEYTADFDKNLANFLFSNGVEKMFDIINGDFSSLTDYLITYCGALKHVTKLTVNRKGIEGAAVTVMPGAGSAGPGSYTIIKEDFTVNRSFGYVITDNSGVPLFSGVINKV